MKKILPSILLILFFNFSYAQVNSLFDSSFGDEGLSIVPILSNSYDYIEDAAIQSDDKIILAGRSKEVGGVYNAGIARLTSDGLLDETFGDNGIVITSVTDANTMAKSVTVLPNNKILVAGYTYGNAMDLFLLRLEEDGSLDPTFGDGGFVLTDINNSDDVSESILVQPDGKIILGGYASVNSDRFCIVRYNEDGSIDPSFGGNGNGYNVLLNDAPNYILSLDLQSDNKIIAAGLGFDFDGNYIFMMVRYNSDGTVDEAFGQDGIIKQNIKSGHDFSVKVKVMEDDKILVGGHTWIDNVPVLMYDLAFTRFLPDGELDESFGENGIVTTKIKKDAENYLNDFDIMDNGKFVATGVCYKAQDGNELYAIRYNEDGSVDNDFNDGGFIIADLPDFPNEDGTTLNFQSDGKIIIGGSAQVNDFANYIAIRLHNPGIGTINLEKDELISVYPNPVSNQLNVKAEDISKEINIQIFDNSGKTIFNQNFNNSITINCQEFSSGIYFIKCTDENNKLISRSKFIKM